VTPGGQLYPSYQAALVAIGAGIGGDAYRRLRDGVAVKGFYVDPVTPDDPDWGRVPKTRRKACERPATPVRCIETGTVYRSASEACKALGIGHKTGIYNSIHRGHCAGGYHWAWAEDVS
jgi:hypothetical protein